MSGDIAGPLAEGEHVDLDTGTTVLRGDGPALGTNEYKVRSAFPNMGTEGRVVLEDEEIRQLAELAGYEVSEPTDYIIAENLIYDTGTPFIRDNTFHRIKERDGRRVVAECGSEFTTEEKCLHTDDSGIMDRDKCKRCFEVDA